MPAVEKEDACPPGRVHQSWAQIMLITADDQQLQCPTKQNVQDVPIL